MRDGIRGCYHLKPRCGAALLMATRSVGRAGVAGLEQLFASKDGTPKPVCGRRVEQGLSAEEVCPAQSRS